MMLRKIVFFTGQPAHTRRYGWLGSLLLLISALAWLLWPKPAQPPRAYMVAASAPKDTTGFARVEGPRPLAFPADHGPHNDTQTEWWYYTGNLKAESGEHFGYQLTFFRRALEPPNLRVERESAWGADQVYMAHFAVTDVAGGKHHSSERFGRGAAGLAGAQAEPYRVWLDDWSVSEEPDGRVVLRAKTDEMALALTLRDRKGPVLQGDRGASRKGPEAGNVSIYYSLPRIDTAGAVTVGGRMFEVEGLSWMDHEFSTIALGPELTGWDWFSLQLSDGSEAMLYALRRSDGSRDLFSSGTLIAPDGSTRPLGPDEFIIEPTGEWRSPRTGSVYPAGWNVTVPSADLRLAVTPYLADQEMRTSLPYWEGAARVSGTSAGQPITGNGYVELTGYARSLQGQF
jgi:predicted secreted hydrolase